MDKKECAGAVTAGRKSYRQEVDMPCGKDVKEALSCSQPVRADRVFPPPAGAARIPQKTLAMEEQKHEEDKKTVCSGPVGGCDDSDFDTGKRVG